MLESPIEKYVCDEAEKSGWYVRKLVFQGRRNAPDRLFVKDGRVVFIEFKRPGKAPRKGQVREAQLLASAGAEVHYTDNPIGAFNILGVKPK